MSKDVYDYFRERALEFQGVRTGGLVHDPVDLDHVVWLKINWERLHKGSERRHSLGEIVGVTEVEDAKFSARYGTLQEIKLIVRRPNQMGSSHWNRLVCDYSDLTGSAINFLSPDEMEKVADKILQFESIFGKVGD